MHENGYEANYAEQYSEPPRSRRSLVQHPAVLLVTVAAIAGLMYMAYQASDQSTAATAPSSIQSDAKDTPAIESDTESSRSAEEPEAVADEDETAGADETASDDAENSSEPSAESAGPVGAATIPAPDGPYVAASLDLDASPGNGLFVLSGRVPTEELALQIARAAELSYAPFVETQLEVDPSLPPAEWLAVAPRVIGLLPGVTDGTLMVTDGKILLSARSPNAEYLQTLQAGLGLLSGGMPIEIVDTVITDLEPPLLTVAVQDDTITLSGYVPSEQVILHLFGAAVATYGENNVINELTSDPGTYRSFWMETMPGVLQLLRVYPNYNFTVADGQFTGVIQGGINFDPNSTEITAATAEALNVGISIMARDISVGLTVTGHTDSQGPDDYNLTLSQARAESVTAYFAAGGIEPARLVAEGAGESEPIASNETESGRAVNRRVEFHFGPVSELAQ